jgi:hypothetical protein
MNPTQSVQDRPEGARVKVAAWAFVVIVLIGAVLLMLSFDYWTSPMAPTIGVGLAVIGPDPFGGSVVK